MQLSDPALARKIVIRLRCVLFGPIARWVILPRAARARLHRLAGGQIHPTATFGANVYVREYPKLHVGEHVWIGPLTYFEDHADVILEKNVWVGARCTFCTATHEIGDSSRRAGPFNVAPIIVAEGAWLGAEVCILPGVNIGAGAVIAAGSVVTGDCATNTLYAGAPAVAKRKLAP